MPSPFASPAAIADDNEQPVPWVFFVAMRGAASAIVAGRIDQIVDALGALPVPALDQHRLAPQRQQSPALMLDGGFVRRHRLIEQRGGFRQIGRDHRRQRNEFGAQRLDRFGREQPIARGRDHHGIEHDVLRRPARQPRDDGIDTGGCATMPILTAPTSRSENTASICAVTNSAGTWWMPLTPGCSARSAP